MHIHLIAIGGAAMHNLAIALKTNGHNVTGSDDEIFEPSRSRLDKHGLLPQTIGWNENRITPKLAAVILGMHAREDNPELKRAHALGLKIYSYPEFMYEMSKDKTRVVIGGSHGKTTITSMVLHVLQSLGRDFDYLVGAQIEGFDTMVKISDAPVIVLEGDEYLSSPIDRRPKFHLYHPQIALVTGIAWDHVNVFPTLENYVEQFQIFIDNLSSGAHLVYFSGDETLTRLALARQSEIELQAYNMPAHEVEAGVTYILHHGHRHRLSVFGDHNLQNLEGARLVCEKLGIDSETYFNAISSFKGAAKRLETLAQGECTAVYKDFAHSPSKLKATTEAVKKQWPDRRLIAVMELHTFSSLKKEFLNEYRGAMAAADEAIVYFNPKTIEHKRLEMLEVEDVKKAFDRADLIVCDDAKQLEGLLRSRDYKNKNLLLMSSGTFSGMDQQVLASDVII